MINKKIDRSFTCDNAVSSDCDESNSILELSYTEHHYVYFLTT